MGMTWQANWEYVVEFGQVLTRIDIRHVWARRLAWG